MIVVIGAGGFIGTYLTTHLQSQGREVLACDVTDIAREFYRREGIPYAHVDITSAADFAALPTSGVDAVVHVACMQPANVSERQYDPADYIRVNVLGTLNVLQYCRAAAVPKILYTCSHRNTQGMWDRMRGSAIRESDGRAIKYTGDYAMFSISESAAADCVQHFSETYGLEGIIFRLPPVYGYGPHTEIFKNGKPIRTGFQIFIDRAQRGEPIELWGDPAAGRDIIYVKDVVNAMVRALERPGVGGLYNISSGRQLSLREQAEAIVRVFSPSDKRSEIRLRPEKANDIESYFYDIAKARDALGWAPQYSFDEMLIDYQRESASARFDYLVAKRREQLRSATTG